MAARRTGRATCEACHSIDVRVWHRNGNLQTGSAFPVSWTIGGRPYGGIHVRTRPSTAILSFQIQSPDAAEPRRFEQAIPIAHTACNYGGARPWFRCTGCNRRVAKLFLAAMDGFRCRHCYDLAYESQCEPMRLRGLAAARKIRTRLGGDANVLEDLPPKPKGMHRRTYENLRRRYDASTARL